MNKPKTLFDHLKAITREQDPNYWDTLTESDRKSWSNFMINRFLSMNEEWTEVIDRLQYVTQTMEPKEVYLTYIGILPKSKRFFKYIKGDKEELHKEWLVDLVKSHFEVGSEQATEYLDILLATDQGRESIAYLCEIYGVEKKKVTSLRLGKK